MSIDADARNAQLRAIFDRLALEHDALGRACFAYFGRQVCAWLELGLSEDVIEFVHQRLRVAASGRCATQPSARFLKGESEDGNRARLEIRLACIGAYRPAANRSRQ